MGFMNSMMQFMVSRMDKAEKDAMMEKMMDKMLSDFTTEEKQKLIETMMPKMMEGINIMEIMPEIMMKMMGGKNEGGMMGMMPNMESGPKGMPMSMMPAMIMEMMPQCLKMMLPNIPKEKRINFILKMVSTLTEHGLTGLSAEEKNQFLDNITEIIKPEP